MSVEKFLDREGRICRWPKKTEERKEVLRYLASKFERGRDYREQEVNEIIHRWHGFSDHTMLRRELCEAGLIERTPDCRRYWTGGAAGTDGEAPGAAT